MKYLNMKHCNIYVKVFDGSCTYWHHISWLCGSVYQLSFGISHDRIDSGNRLITTE